MDGTITAELARDLLRWRADTPGCSRVVHLNNAGAALVPRVVHESVRAHLDLEQEIGGYEAAESQAGAIQESYEAVAAVIGSQARNIAMVQNSTVAFAQAISAFDLSSGDVILTSRSDYASNQIMYLSLSRRRGVEVLRAPDAPEGGIDPAAVRQLVARRRPALVALTWIPTNSGLVQPVEEVGRICREADLPYLIDACQAVGQVPIEVDQLGCDFLAATARKFLRGPRGIGFLYIARRMLESGAHPLLVDMHGATWTEADDFVLAPDARRFEYWEFPHALVLGLGAAARYANEVGLEVARDRARDLAEYVRERLGDLQGTRVLDRGPELCAIATAAIEGRNAGEVKLALRSRGINTSSPEREDAVIDMDQKSATSALRISPHYYNTKEEIDLFIEALGDVLSGNLEMSGRSERVSS
ncbi:MAG TPA: aminotransferase class V-fold PLP-dependent enzyme [Gemmatimonadales bacterium]|nr:aminotransferase class V-fold PLP-dependent enzyme [Gemmatimonadales bacterium]